VGQKEVRVRRWNTYPVSIMKAILDCGKEQDRIARGKERGREGKNERAEEG